MYKNQVRRTRGFLRIMPVKHKAERAGVEGESLQVIKKKKKRRKKERGRVPQTILPL